MKVLGLDLGSNSIGWALINESTQEIIDMGVRIFPDGVENYGQGSKEASHSVARREARGARRLKYRRRLRKAKLASILKGITLNQFWPKNETEMEAFRLMNPYELRAKALVDKLEPLQLARIWAQMAHRRGYKSTGVDKETKALYEGKDKDGVTIKGITETKEEWERSGAPTIGAYLASIQHIPGKNEYAKIRSRYSLRKWLVEEFDLIWEYQSKFYSEILTQELKTEIKDRTIFYQRPLKVVPEKDKAKCSIFKDELRESAHHPVIQYFNLLSVLNNFRYYHKNTPDEKKSIPTQHHPQIVATLMWEANFTSLKILQKLKLSGAENGEYLTNFDHEIKIKACPFMNSLTKKIISGSNSNKVKSWGLEKIEALYDLLVSDKLDNDEKIEAILKQFGLTKEATLTLLDNLAVKKYSSVSLKGAKALLPLMKGGGIDNDGVIYDKPLRYDEAYKIVTGRNHNLFDELEARSGRKLMLPPTPDLRNPVVNRTLSELRAVVNCILKHYGKPDKIHIEMGRDITKSADDRQQISKSNNLNREENEQAAEMIQKELQGSIVPSRGKQLRYRLWKDQEGKCIYTGKNIPISDLFDSGKVDVDHIYPKSLYHDDSYQNKVVCFRNANADKGQQTPKEWLANKPEQYRQVLQNAESFKRKAPGKYKRFEYNPGEGEEGGKEGFVERQLNDTRYAARVARKYLSAIIKYENIFGTKGAYTAVLRRDWLDRKDEPLLINPILDPFLPWIKTDNTNQVKLHKKEVQSGKHRLDHRHHAVDALVIALCNQKMMQELNKLSYKKTVQKEDGRQVEYISYKLPSNWKNLFEQAKEKVNRIVVSYKVEEKTNGQLHKETYYGKIQLPPSPKKGNFDLKIASSDTDNRKVAVVRKKVEALSKEEVLNIVDHQVRSIIHSYILEKMPSWTPGMDFGKILKECPRFFLKHKNGNPITKVRVAANMPSLILIREKVAPVYVDPQSNHHALLYINSETGKIRGEIVQTYVVARAYNGKKESFKPLPKPKTNEEFLFSLRANELVYIYKNLPIQAQLLNDKNNYIELAPYIYRVQNLDNGNNRAIYRQQWLAKIELLLSNDVKIQDCGRRIISFTAERVYKLHIDAAGFLSLV